MSILSQAEGYLAGTGGMCVEEAARALVELYKAAQAVVDIWKQTSSFIRVNPILANLAAKLEELEGGA